MLNLNYNFWSVFIIFIYIYIETFFSIIFYSIFKNTKNFSVNYSKKIITNINNKEIFKLYLYFLFFYFLYLKIDFINNFILSFFILYILFINFIKSEISSNYNFLIFNISYFLIFFKNINSLILFFIFIELYSIIFYFFFIIYNNEQNIDILKYKNLLLLYLFNNFFSTLLFLIGVYYVISYYGTLNFIELDYLYKNKHWEVYFIIISFIIKLSLPSFHFLKIEIYKYLNFDVIILYSLFTLILNYSFMTFLFSQNLIYITLENYKFFNLLLILAVFIFIQKLKLNNFQEFIAYSGFSVNMLIIIAYTIN